METTDLLGATLALSIPGCHRCDPGPAKPHDPYEMGWTELSHPALQAGASRRAYHALWATQFVGDWYVFRADGTRVRTLEELRTVLRPLDTEELVLAYRDLIGTVDIERDESLIALKETTPLVYRDERAYGGLYDGEDAQRWDVGRERVVEEKADGFVITEPSFRWWFRYHEDGDLSPIKMTVELVRETIGRDGSYRREVVRLLEEGKSAAAYQPMPL